MPRVPLPAPAAARKIHQSFLRDRQVESRLKLALKQADAGEIAAAIDHLQAIIEKPDDSFLLLDGSADAVSARWHAAAVLGRLPASARQIYETVYGGLARDQYQRAVQSGDQAALERLLVQYFYTRAGAEACRRLADLALERGELQRAAYFWRRMYSDPLHCQQMTAAQLFKGAYCSELAGDLQTAEQMRTLIRGRTVAVAGRAVTLVPIMTAAVATETDDETAGGVEQITATVNQSSVRATDQLGLTMPLRMSSGSDFIHLTGASVSSRSGSSGSPPVLTSELWRSSFSSPASQHLELLTNAWSNYQTQNSLPLGTAQSPIVVGTKLLFRDFEGVRCAEIATGQTVWQYRAASSLARDIPAPVAVPVEGNPDPANIKRLWMGNALAGTISSDGKRVFAIEGIESRWNQSAIATADGRDPIALARQSNQLIALPLAAKQVSFETPLWTVGGAAGGAGDGHAAPALQGHFFLGAPLAVDGRLYVLSEAQSQFFVSCLEPSNGQLLWKTPLGTATTPIYLDQQRYYLHASPVLSQGVLVCPTHSGLLMGLDPITGMPLWGYVYDDAEQLQLLGAWPNNTRHQYGHAGYPNQPLVSGRKVVYLPPHSDQIHCLDLQSGQTCWQVRRQDLDEPHAIEYVAAIETNVVLVVGRLRCRGLDLETGREVWTVPLSATPSGRGVALDGGYVVPLADGSVFYVDVPTGYRSGVSLPREKLQLGNLVAGAGVILSATPNGIRAWSQAAPLLARLDERTLQAARTPEQRLLAAEVHLAMGQTLAAKSDLQRVLIEADSTFAQNEAERMLRELLFAELGRSNVAKDDLYRELQPLLKDQSQRGRFLVHRTLQEQNSGNSKQILAAVEELLALELSQPLALDHDPSRVVTAEAWARHLLRNLPARDRARWELELARRLPDWNDSRSGRSKDELVLLAMHSEPVHQTRLDRAKRLISEGSIQSAEIQLLWSQQHGGPVESLRATRMLAELLAQRGLPHEAALLLQDLSRRPAELDQTFRPQDEQYLQSVDPSGMLTEAVRRLQPVDWTHKRPVIREVRWIDPSLQATYNASGIQYLPTPRGCSYDLFDKGRGSGGLLSLVDRQTGFQFEESIRIPSRYTYPVFAQQSFVGHLLPLGTLGAAHGVSLLERDVVWTVIPPGLQSRAESVKVGPAGPEFASFQCRQNLFVVDPATGQLLWQRTDLESLSGLMVDATGLIGDHEVLVLFSADRSHFIVYDTATGEELRRGRLDAERKHLRRAFGRMLVYLAGHGPEKRLRIWDPLTDECLLDLSTDDLADVSLMAGVPIGTKAYHFVNGSDELAYVTADAQLVVVDVATGAIRLTCDLDPALLENLGQLRVWSDRERYYANIQQVSQNGSVSPQNSFVASDATIPLMHTQGLVVAIDRGTQQLLWSRHLGNRSFLQLPEYQFPFLVTVCRVRDEKQKLLNNQVELLDASTGGVMIRHDRLLPDRLLQVHFDRDRPSLCFRGARTTISVDFDGPRPLELEDVTAAANSPRQPFDLK